MLGPHPCFLSIVAGELLMAWAAGRSAPAVRIWTDHIYRRSEPWKGTKSALVLLLWPHRDLELTCPWRPCLFYSTKRAISCSVLPGLGLWSDTDLLTQPLYGFMCQYHACRASSVSSRGCSRTEILSFDIHSFSLAPGQSASSFTSATKEGIAPRECVSIFVNWMSSHTTAVLQVDAADHEVQRRIFKMRVYCIHHGPTTCRYKQLFWTEHLESSI